MKTICFCRRGITLHNYIDITANVNDKTIRKDGIDIIYPLVTGLNSRKAEKRINSYINEKLFRYIKKAGYGKNTVKELNVNYEIKLNMKAVISINLIISSISDDAEKTNTVKSINCSLRSGRVYKLENIISSEQNSYNAINNIIRQQIQERNIPLIKEFKGISSHTAFYITEDSLVFYFQVNEYTSYESGIPQFPIRFDLIKDILKLDNGPIKRLISKQ